MRYLMALLLWLPVSAWAANWAVGEPLPPLTLPEPGEFVLADKKQQGIQNRPWSTDSLVGKVHVLQYMAAQPRSRRMVQPFTDAYDAAGFPAEQVQVVTVVNVQDVPFGAVGLALRQLASNKRRYPESRIIADVDSKGLKAWSLEPGGVATAILDAEGQVLYFKEGRMSPTEVEKALGVIQRQLGPDSVMARSAPVSL